MQLSYVGNFVVFWSGRGEFNKIQTVAHFDNFILYIGNKNQR